MLDNETRPISIRQFGANFADGAASTDHRRGQMVAPYWGNISCRLNSTDEAIVKFKRRMMVAK